MTLGYVLQCRIYTDENGISFKIIFFSFTVSATNKAIYTTASVACGWAGAVTQICSPFSTKCPKSRSDYGQSDNRWTDRPTNIVTYRLACPRLKSAVDIIDLYCDNFLFSAIFT